MNFEVILPSRYFLSTGFRFLATETLKVLKPLGSFGPKFIKQEGRIFAPLLKLFAELQIALDKYGQAATASPSGSLTISNSMLMVTSSPTSTPPVSRATFQVSPQSLRLIRA